MSGSNCIYKRCFTDFCIEVYQDKIIVITWGKMIVVEGKVERVYER